MIRRRHFPGNDEIRVLVWSVLDRNTITRRLSMSMTRIHTVGVPVSDQSRALEFYTGTLGLETRRDVRYGDDVRWVEVAPPDAVTSIALVLPGPSSPIGTDTGIRFATTDADAEHGRLRSAGVDVDPEVMHFAGVPPMFSLRDPDGNILYLVEDMPQS
jgi:predicted enzyme related to lactoylglutathione lyase